MSQNELVPVGPRPTDLLPGATEWSILTQMAQVLYQSGFIPQHIKSANAALAAMLKGRELGIPPTQALGNIIVVQGKPTANAELMAALIYRDHGDQALEYTETTNERCTISYKRRGAAKRGEYSFTIEDARKAGLIKGGPWQNFPAAMLRARCISAVARFAFPDSISGMYTHEELGVPVKVDEDGVVVADVANIQTEDVATRTTEQTQEDLTTRKARLLELCQSMGLVIPKSLGDVKRLSGEFGVEPNVQNMGIWYDTLIAAMERTINTLASPPSPSLFDTSDEQVEARAADLDMQEVTALLDSFMTSNADLGTGKPLADQRKLILESAAGAQVNQAGVPYLLGALFPMKADDRGQCGIDNLTRQEAAATLMFLRTDTGRRSALALMESAAIGESLPV